MFPDKFLASTQVEAEKIRVEGCGIAIVLPLEFERILVTVGDFVLRQCVGNEHFGFGADTLALVCCVYRGIGRKGEAFVGFCFPLVCLLLVCKSQRCDEALASGAHLFVKSLYVWSCFEICL